MAAQLQHMYNEQAGSAFSHNVISHTYFRTHGSHSGLYVVLYRVWNDAMRSAGVCEEHVASGFRVKE
jgi:hypothetical protein